MGRILDLLWDNACLFYGLLLAAGGICYCMGNQLADSLRIDNIKDSIIHSSGGSLHKKHFHCLLDNLLLCYGICFSAVEEAASLSSA